MKAGNINSYNRDIIRNVYDRAEAEKGKDFGKILDKMQKEKDRKKLKEACQELEAMFVSMVFERMRATVRKEGFIKESFGEKMFQSMLDKELAKKASSGEGLGISKMLYDQLVKNLDR